MRLVSTCQQRLNCKILHIQSSFHASVISIAAKYLTCEHLHTYVNLSSKLQTNITISCKGIDSSLTRNDPIWARVGLPSSALSRVRNGILIGAFMFPPSASQSRQTSPFFLGRLLLLSMGEADGYINPSESLLNRGGPALKYAKSITRNHELAVPQMGRTRGNFSELVTC